MTAADESGLWQQLQSGNPWWPSYQPHQDDVLSWRHAAAILLRDVEPVPIFADLSVLFEAIYDQTADAVCDRCSGADGRLTWDFWFDVWCEHFDSWNDPVRQLVEQQCGEGDTRHFAPMLTRMNGAAVCDFVLDAYERAMIEAAALGEAFFEPALPLQTFAISGWPFERLAHGYYVRFCAGIDQEPERPDGPIAALDLNRAGHPQSCVGDAQ